MIFKMSLLCAFRGPSTVGTNSPKVGFFFFSGYFYLHRAYFGMKGEVGSAPTWTVQFSMQCTDLKHSFLPEKDAKYVVVYFQICTNPSPTFLAVSLLSPVYIYVPQ